MFCKNCGNNLKVNTSFCNKCGKKIEETDLNVVGNTQQEFKKDDMSIINIKLKQVADHLEFLGYQVNKFETKEQTDKELMVATHLNNNNILFWEFLPNFVMFKISLTTGRKPSAKINQFINAANKKFNITRIYYDVEDSLVVLRLEAVYIGSYSKEIFGQFYEFFNNDQKSLNLLENFSELFLD